MELHMDLHMADEASHVSQTINSTDLQVSSAIKDCKAACGYMSVQISDKSGARHGRKPQAKQIVRAAGVPAICYHCNTAQFPAIVAFLGETGKGGTQCSTMLAAIHITTGKLLHTRM